MKMFRAICWGWGLACLLVSPTVGQIFSPQRLLGRYQQFIWQDQHGLPQNGISAIVQTRDGYLWLATAEGVVRFDGVRFTAFDTGNTKEIKSNNIMSLLVDRHNALWIGTNGGGLSRYREGRFTVALTQDGLSDNHARSLFEDHAGNLWVGTDGGGLNVCKNGPQGREERFTIYTTKDGLPDDHIWAITEDTAGNLWVGTNNGLACFKDGRFVVYKKQDGLASNAVRALYQDRAGTLWVGTNAGLCRFIAGRFTRFANEGVPRELQTKEIRALAQDREGGIWIGTIGGGLYQFQKEMFVACTARDGLANDSIQAIYQDPEGDWWLGTSGSGLAQLRTGRFITYTKENGLLSDMVKAVYEDSAGGIWVGTDGGLSRFKEGKSTAYVSKDGHPFKSVTGISEDRGGNLWINSNDHDTGRKIVRPRADSAILEEVAENGFKYQGVAMVQDRVGNIWIANPYAGLTLLRNGRQTLFTRRDGLADDYVNVLYEDRQGHLWIGTRSGLSWFNDNRFTTWTAHEGFADHHVLSFYEDRTGVIWIGTHGDGLYRFKNGKFAVITSKDGLYDNLAFQILEDDRGNLWMSGNKGIYRANLQELNEFADGHLKAVNSFAYGMADGMLSRECNGANPAGVKARDGQLWFPTIKGVVVVDPNKLSLQPPLVVIEQVLLDQVGLPAGVRVQVNPGQQELEIQYTALSWNRPQQIKFKYQLLGLNQDWVDAGTRRTANYAHLAPGEYTFRLIADNGEGVWNTAGQSLRIVVLAPFYRRWWFFLLVLAGSIGVVWSAWKLRVRQLERVRSLQESFSQRMIESQESERKRIAAELHDGLGQSLLVIQNRALLAGLSPDNEAATQTQFEQIRVATSQALDEVRQITYNLRPYHLDRLGLTHSLEAMIERVAETSPIHFTSNLAELEGVFSKDEEILFYRIVQESLNNIVKHSAATAATIVVNRAEDQLTLRIQDNGRGFSPGSSWLREADEPKQGGFGLVGITERVRILKGTHLIESAPEQGTTITLTFHLK